MAGAGERQSVSVLVMSVAANYLLVREEPIPRLERTIFALSEAARRTDQEPGKILSALRIAAECVSCHARVSLEELVVLSQMPEPGESIRIRRLRLGYCVQEGCQCPDYRLFIGADPDANWTAPCFSPEIVAE